MLGLVLANSAVQIKIAEANATRLIAADQKQKDQTLCSRSTCGGDGRVEN